jgi:hypothetical protein
MTFALWQAFAVGRSSRVTRRKAASDPLRNSTSIYECFSTHGNSGGGVCALLYGLSARPGTKYEKKKWYGMSADIRENTENRPTE